MKIAMIGDLHYPSIDEAIPGLKESRTVFYEKFMKQFLETEADFHVSIGDLTNYGTESELTEIYGLINQSKTTMLTRTTTAKSLEGCLTARYALLLLLLDYDFLRSCARFADVRKLSLWQLDRQISPVQ